MPASYTPVLNKVNTVGKSLQYLGISNESDIDYEFFDSGNGEELNDSIESPEEIISVKMKPSEMSRVKFKDEINCNVQHVGDKQNCSPCRVPPSPPRNPSLMNQDDKLKENITSLRILPKSPSNLDDKVQTASSPQRRAHPTKSVVRGSVTKASLKGCNVSTPERNGVDTLHPSREGISGCSSAVSKKGRETRSACKRRELMNCIAFEDGGGDARLSNLARINSNDSLSSDTTSDITDVTPRPSSSGCSSMTRDGPSTEPSKYDYGKSMKLLVKIIEDFNLDGRSMSSGSSKVWTPTGSKSPSSKANMTFSKEETRRIDRENQLLLRKIHENRRPKHRGGLATRPQPHTTSAAINRRRQQIRIEYDNQILKRRISQAKSTINPMGSRT